jgi:uncharacterized SAM-binding protein YcdF (DUF218 family)
MRVAEIRATLGAMPPHRSDSWRSYFGPGAASSFLLASATACLGLGLPVAAQLRRVLRTARGAKPQACDAVLVLGRALRGDQPTAVFRARLDHAAALFEHGWAPRVVVAGGLTGDASRSEADAGQEYLVARGVPVASILREDRSRHTLENLYFVREDWRRHGWRSLLLVSDPLHLARAAAYAEGLGMEVVPSPAVAAAPAGIAYALRALREAFFLHWYHVGVAYSRMIRSRRMLERVT